MAIPPNFSRLDKGDFKKEYQDLVDRLGYILNPFMEQTNKAFKGKIDFQNLNQQIFTINVIVDASGTPVQKTQYKSTLNTKVFGVSVLSATNSTSPSSYPSATPFVSFTQAEDIVTINNISGLTANNKYSLNILSIGS